MVSRRLAGPAKLRLGDVAELFLLAEPVFAMLSGLGTAEFGHLRWRTDGGSGGHERRLADGWNKANRGGGNPFASGVDG